MLRFEILFLLCFAAARVASQGTSCSTSLDCPEDAFCSTSEGTCLAMGGCFDVSDCDNIENSFMMATCVGTRTCENGSCGIICDGADTDTNDQCQTSDDCPAEWYCSVGRNNPLGLKVCNAMGFCNDVSDCENPDNQFGMAMCVGTKTCENGTCGIVCDEGPPEDISSCSSSTDCPADTYCNPTINECTEMGSCVALSDCGDPNNQFFLATCIGTETCENGSCGIDCGDGCDFDLDCASGVEYCASDGICRPVGGCSAVEDCENPSNPLMMIDCLGTLSCEFGSCTKECDEVFDETCFSKEDCEEDEFCAQNAKCRPMGTCGRKRDCTDPDNIFPTIACVGSFRCDAGGCLKTCDGAEEEEDGSCETSGDCAFEEYCASTGECLPTGSCVEDNDCTADGNSFPMPLCMGAISCTDAGACNVDCEGQKVSSDAGGSCTETSDCASESEYCSGEGVCLPDGSCMADDDCVNPDNVFASIACVGTLSCDNGGCSKTCDGASAAVGSSTVCSWWISAAGLVAVWLTALVH